LEGENDSVIFSTKTIAGTRFFIKASGANALLESVMRVTKQMQTLDISISGTKKPTVIDGTKESGPTIERTNKANAESGGITSVGARFFQDDLLIRLANKGQLYPDATINMACRLAGEKYYADWYGSGMSPLKAIDYGRISGGKIGSGSHVAPGMMVAKRREQYRAARAELPEKIRKVVELILLQDQSDLVAVGKAVTGSAVPSTCRTVAIERFTFGLYLLAKHYAMVK
jgi:hypothetical protein